MARRQAKMGNTPSHTDFPSSSASGSSREEAQSELKGARAAAGQGPGQLEHSGKLARKLIGRKLEDAELAGKLEEDPAGDRYPGREGTGGQGGEGSIKGTVEAKSEDGKWAAACAQIQ